MARSSLFHGPLLAIISVTQDQLQSKDTSAGLQSLKRDHTTFTVVCSVLLNSFCTWLMTPCSRGCMCVGNCVGKLAYLEFTVYWMCRNRTHISEVGLLSRWKCGSEQPCGAASAAGGCIVEGSSGGKPAACSLEESLCTAVRR